LCLEIIKNIAFLQIVDLMKFLLPATLWLQIAITLSGIIILDHLILIHELMNSIHHFICIYILYILFVKNILFIFYNFLKNHYDCYIFIEYNNNNDPIEKEFH